MECRSYSQESEENGHERGVTNVHSVREMHA